MKGQPFLTAASVALALSAIAIVSAGLARQTAAGAAPDAAFQAMDKDHDGRLSRSEIPADMTLLRTRFSTYDANQDNKLDPQEFATAKAAVQGGSNATSGQDDNDENQPPQTPQQEPQPSSPPGG